MAATYTVTSDIGHLVSPLVRFGTEEQLKRTKMTELKMNVTTKPSWKRKMLAFSLSVTVWTFATPDQRVIVGVIQHSATL